MKRGLIISLLILVLFVLIGSFVYADGELGMCPNPGDSWICSEGDTITLMTKDLACIEGIHKCAQGNPGHCNNQVELDGKKVSKCCHAPYAQHGTTYDRLMNYQLRSQVGLPDFCCVDSDCGDANMCTLDVCDISGSCSSITNPAKEGDSCVLDDGCFGYCSSGDCVEKSDYYDKLTNYNDFSEEEDLSDDEFLNGMLSSAGSESNIPGENDPESYWCPTSEERMNNFKEKLGVNFKCVEFEAGGASWEIRFSVGGKTGLEIRGSF